MPERAAALTLTPAKIAELRRRRRAETRRRRRIAVVGMACRFPGAPDLARFWRLLEAGAGGATAGRSENGGPGPDGPYWGGYLSGLDRFDAAFFRIAPVEAEQLDPQQRLLLETGWEALEHAAIAPGSLRGSRSGVYVAMAHSDYRLLAREPSLYAASGVGLSTASGRLAFTLGLAGPAITVDTACSGSLVATHLAASALQSGEVDLALCGGVNAILNEDGHLAFGQGGMLAEDGRCKTFDAAADGFVRGEGCGILVLKRLADAESDGDRILGVIAGSALNQDGASAGLTVPNGPAQEQVIREALARAEVPAAEVDYLEAHGTGTELGDPIEVHAAGAVYGEGRTAQRPLLLGSVKTNVGHLESAAGVAGVIKTVLALRHRRIPRHRNFERPNPRIAWDRFPVQVTSEATPWPDSGDRPPRAAVSSFGLSGTNAHAILEAYAGPGEEMGVRVPVTAAGAEDGAAAPEPRRVRVLPLSARAPRALHELAGRYLQWLGEDPDEASWDRLSDAAFVAGAGRSHFAERAAPVFRDAAGLGKELRALGAAGAREAPGPEAPAVESPAAPAGKVAFLFTGQGSQWVAMGRDLYEREPVARRTLDRAEAVIRDERGVSLLEVMFGAEGGCGDLDATEWAQPALYALQAALVALWKSVGIEPDAVLGHSVGEIAASAAAGVFGFEDGLRFAARRGALMGSLPRKGRGRGDMLAVFAAGNAALSLLKEARAGGLDLAADNGTHLVVSGPAGPLAAFRKGLRAAGIRTGRLRTSHAFHSSLMDPILDELLEAAGKLAPAAPVTALVTGVTGRVAGSAELADAAYWRRHARAPVRFAAGVRTLAEMGSKLLIEIGPQPVLGPLAALCWPAPDGVSPRSSPILAPSQTGSGEAGDEGFARAVAQAYEAGLPVAFEGLFAGERRRKVSAPTYPFQRERYWMPDAGRQATGVGHGLLGSRRELPGGEISFEISCGALPWLAGQRIFGRPVAPGALYGAAALAALAAVKPETAPVCVADLRIGRPLVLADTEIPGGGKAPRTLQFVLGSVKDGAAREFEVFSRGDPEGPWTRHATGRIGAEDVGGVEDLPASELDGLRVGLSEAGATELYDEFQRVGIAIAGPLRGVVRLRAGARSALGELRLPAEVAEDADAAPTVLLESCFQVLGGIGLSGAGAPWAPVGWERLRIRDALPDRILCHAALRDDAPAGGRRADLDIYAVEGSALGEVRGIDLRPASRGALLAAATGSEELLYGLEWRRAEASGPEPAAGRDAGSTEPGLFVLWPHAAGPASELARDLEARGHRVIAPGPGETPEGATLFDPRSREGWREFFRLLPGSPALRGVLHCEGLAGRASPDEPLDPPAVASELAASALALVQGLHDAGVNPRLGVCLLTAGAQVVSGERSGGLAGSVLWGFGRTVAREFRGLPVRLLDLDPGGELRPHSLADEILFPGPEDEIAWREDVRWAPRLIRLPGAGGRRPERDPVRRDRSYLVTGGFGGIGMRVAAWLAGAGAGGIVLNGRREPEREDLEAVETLRARGTAVQLEIADVADEAAVERLVDSIGESALPPLGGVIHCAGTLSDRSLLNQDRSSFERVLAPKARGAWNLHRATLAAELDLFVLFSSFAALAGTPGQSNYAAANAFLDQLARWRRSQGLPGQAIAWGAWSGQGMAERRRERLETDLKTAGSGWMTPEQGIAALEQLIHSDVETGAAAVVDWDVAGARGLPPRFGDFASAAGPPVEMAPDGLSEFLASDPEDREARLIAFLGEQVRSVLRVPAPPAPDVGFFELGMDSLTALELRDRVDRALPGDVRVRGTVAFDYPDIRRLARHLAGQLEGAPRAAPTAAGLGRVLSIPDEPVAIVGMAGRLPGASDLRTFWSRMMAGADLVTEGRAEDLTGPDGNQNDALRAGYVAELDRFDAAFFRIPPVEAEVMDPQQRLLLETSWEALEDAALDPDTLRGSRTGVYAGITNRDYEHFVSFDESDPAKSLYLATGNGLAAAIGRVSFALGLQGPAIAVDTACSSSLVAIHQAVAALQRGEADLALAGGVNAILLPDVTRLSRTAGMLAPDGRCKTFDAAADGYVRGEGCGMVVLRRLTDAEREQDRILAVILGSAVNQDGASAGLTVPNGPAQEAVIREALARARIAPRGVDYLEAHGTGTELGDPIEVQAAAAVYGEGRDPERPLLLGSVKTNIGHLEAAAGVAGVIKAVLALGHRRIPRHLHFRQPNPQVDWERLPVQVTKDGTHWPEVEGRPPRAAVSSFGYSGTNAHLVLECYEPDHSRSPPLVPVAEANGRASVPRRARLLPLAAQTPAALGALAGRYLAWLEEGSGERSAEELSDAAWTAGVGRRHFRERAGLVFTGFAGENGAAALRERLTELASGAPLLEPRPTTEETHGKVAFLFTGQGSQWPGMGQDLYEREPVVRAVLDRAEAVFGEERGASLLAAMFGRSGARTRVDRTEWAQPALYALEVALAELWKSLGIEPKVVLGHSVGEIAAAHTAGVFGFEEGLRFAARRGALMGALPRRGKRAGGMLAVFAAAETVASALGEGAEADGPSLELAADNGSHQVVSGPVGPLQALEGRLSEEGVRSERLATSHGFHSAMMEPVLEELEEAATELGASAPAISLVTNVTGRAAAGGEVEDGAYWRRQARAPVRFAAGVATLGELGCGTLIEVGPRAVLGPLAAVSWPETGVEPLVIASQRGAAGEEDEAFLRAVAGAYEGGLSVRFAALFAGERRRRIAVPSYPFERRRHWVRQRRRAPAGGHSLLGVGRDLPSGETSFEIPVAELDWLNEHRVFGRAVAPAAFHAAQALAALSHTGGPAEALVVSQMRLKGPLLIEGREGESDRGDRVVQVVLGPEGPGADEFRSFEVFSRAAGERSWVPHAAGRVGTSAPPGEEALSAAALDDLKSAWSPVAPGAVYARFRSAGVEHGPSFQALLGLWVGDGEAAGELRFPSGLAPGQAKTVALDACLSVMEGLRISADAELPGRDDAWLPARWERLFLNESLPERVICRAWLRNVREREGVPTALQVDLRFYAEEGALLGGVTGLQLVRASRPAGGELPNAVEWRNAPPLRGAVFLDPPETVVGNLRAAGRRLAAEGLTLERVAGLDRGLAQLAAGYALSTLGRLGWTPRPGAALDIANIRTRYGVKDPFRRLFARLFAILEDAGVVIRDGAGSTATAVVGRADLPEGLREPDELAERLLREHPEGSWEIRLLKRVGAALPEVLRGRAHAAVLLIAGDVGIEGMDRDSPGQGAALGWMAEAVASLARKLPEGRRLRVLEVGAGPGSATRLIVPRLPAGRTDYTVTDLLETYFEEQREHFRGAEVRMEFGVLDLERDPAGQGFDLHSFDLVLASNSLHPTRDLAESLGNMRRLLAPSGVVVVLEGAGRRAWIDLTFGLLEAWWRFDDRYRIDQAMAEPEAWERAFSDAGYPAMRFLDAGEEAGGTGPAVEGKGGPPGPTIGRVWVTVQGVMVARGPAEIQPDPEDLVVHPSVAEFDTPVDDLRARLATADPGGRETMLARFLAGEVQALLGLSAAPPDDAGFFELGMNSLMAVELRNRIRRAFAGEIEAPQTVVLDYPTIGRLAAFLAPQLGGLDRTPHVPVRRPAVSRSDGRIAIVGMACRFPGGDDPEEFWSRLEAGADLVRDGRPDELMLGADELEQAFAGYVAGMDLFDAEFFRIAPVEAELMDPQQRLLLETSWLAVEDAGLDPEALRGSRTGVYAGIMGSDYGHILQRADSDPARGGYLATASGSAAAIGRVSFALGFQGPAVAVDTACSSSLVAIHQAAGSLLSGESDLALAGGVNAILSAVTTKMCLVAGMLSPDGRCKTFDARANGIARGEGCGVVVLKRLEAAERDGDRILGVLLGSAVNQDGASAGFTVPNGPAQEQVIREALDRAGIKPASVDYLEAHGTGTELGDPIEVQAAAAAYGEDRASDRPLLLGSVKANVGHLEAAAGVAGVIKVLLSIQHGLIPKQLHFETPNPKVDWPRLPVRVIADSIAWPEVPDRPVRAGVSSFGFSGTNAHLVLEGYGKEEGASIGVPVAGLEEVPAEAPERRVRVLPLSARSGPALSALAGRYLNWLEERDRDWEGLSDGTWTAGVGRSHFAYRAGVVFSGPHREKWGPELREQLEALASGGVREETPVAAASRVGFLFTGQGSQWVGMGRNLYEREPVFREVLDRAEEAIREERGESLLAVMFRGDAGGDLDATEWTQPALYALQGALLALWRSVGVEPDAVLGHSVGEISAAHAAGVFGFEEGLRFASRRGALMGSLPRSGRGSGGMLAVFAPLPVVLPVISELNAGVRVPLDLAAENGTHQVVSGPPGLVGKLSRRLSGDGVRVERLSVSHAFHSGLMDPVLDALEAAAVGLSFGAPSVPLVSGLTGRVAGPAALEGAYWRRQARLPVRFAPAVETLGELGSRVLIELGPRPVLGPLAAVAWSGEEAPVIASSQDGPEVLEDDSFARAVARAYEAGVPVSFKGLYGGERRRRVSVPTYPFERKHHWVQADRGASRDGHPLLGVRHEQVTGEVAFQKEIAADWPAWLADHRVAGLVIAPGALYAAQALAAVRSPGPAPAVRFVDELEIERPLVLTGSEAPVHENERRRPVQVVMGEKDAAGAARFEVFSRGADSGNWVRHAAGQVATGLPSAAPDQAPIDPEAIREGLSEASPDALYARLAEAGLHYGPSFRGITRLWAGTREVLAELHRPPDLSLEHGALHPAFLDTCLHVLAGVRRETPEAPEALWLPVGWERLWVRGEFADGLLCHAALRSPEGADSRGVETADLWFYDASGATLGGVRGFRLRRVNQAALRSASASVDALLYRVEWFASGSPGAGGLLPASFLARPRAVARTRSRPLGPDDQRLLLDLGAGLERLARSWTLRAFDQLGWKRRPGAAVEAERLRQRLKVVEQHRGLFRRLLAILAEVGVLDASADGWRVGAAVRHGLPEALGDPQKIALDLRAAHPEGAVEIALLARCGAALADVLRGRTDGLDLLFSGEPSAEDLYRDASAYRAWNAGIAQAAGELVAGLPEGRRLRVLEVGAGTGATTEALLGALPADQTDYAYTDISRSFFAGAEARFQEFPGLDCHVLDIEREPQGQGFPLHGYDVVVAANVLHATRDLAASLAHCRRLLAPSGVLLVLEGVEPRSFLDLTFGLLPGWWRFDDAYRTDYALVAPTVWKRALGDAGFSEVAAVETSGGAAVLVARGPAEVKPDPGAWVVWPGNAGGSTGAAVAQELRSRGQTVVTLEGEASTTGPLARESWRALFTGLPASPPLAGVVHCGGAEGPGSEASAPELAAALERAAGSALALSQGLYDAGASPSLGMSFVTRGGQLQDGDGAGELSGAAVWGFGRAAAREFGTLPVRLLDLDPQNGDVRRLVDELLFPDREPEAALRGDRRLVSRLVRLPAAAGDASRKQPVRADRSYLVTGGLGGIGLRVAGWLAAQGAGAVFLNGRRAPDPEAAAAVSALRARGVEVRVEIADVADGGAVEAMLSRVAESGLPPLGGVIHSVGRLADRTIPSQDWRNFERLLGPKVLGAWHLHRATLSLDLDLFVLFSSMVGVIGSPGQANYAAANAFLDQLALFRRAKGLPGQAIAWGGWSEVGEAEEIRDRVEERMEALGAGWMTPDQGIAALARLVRDDVGSGAVSAWDWDRARTTVPLLERLARAGSARSAAPDLVERLLRAGAADRRDQLIAFVREEVQSVLRLSSAPAPDVGFFDVGMDSLMAVELRNRVNRALAGAYTAPNTLIFDHPTIADLAAHLAEALGHGNITPSAAEPEDAAAVAYERVRDLEADAFLSEAEAYLGPTTGKEDGGQ